MSVGVPLAQRASEVRGAATAPAPVPVRPPVIGVLALQGDFAAHETVLQRAGAATRQVRAARALDGLDGLVLPGGESTTMVRLLQIEGLWDPLEAALRSGLPTLATCAGLILVAAEVRQPSQRAFGLVDVTVERNAYGRQVHSGTFPLEGDALPAGTAGVFIRAPRIVRCGPGVEVLARRAGDPVLVRAGAILGACFHPELQPGHPVTAMFVGATRRHAERCAREGSR